jgi:hypothetical protein
MPKESPLPVSLHYCRSESRQLFRCLFHPMGGLCRDHLVLLCLAAGWIRGGKVIEIRRAVSLTTGPTKRIVANLPQEPRQGIDLDR